MLGAGGRGAGLQVPQQLLSQSLKAWYEPQFSCWRLGESVLAHSLPECDCAVEPPLGLTLGPEVYLGVPQCPQELPQRALELPRAPLLCPERVVGWSAGTSGGWMQALGSNDARSHALSPA